MHAIKTTEERPFKEIKQSDVSWSIMGSVPQNDNSKNVTGLCHRILVRELPPVMPAAVIKAHELHFEDSQMREKSISQEDVQFLQVLKDGVHQNDHGHIEMPLPVKVHLHLPATRTTDNKKLALVQLIHLKRKLDRDSKFKHDYVRFMEGIFRDGDAEKLNEQPQSGNVWYIPHQGVYYSRKPVEEIVVLTALLSMKVQP